MSGQQPPLTCDQIKDILSLLGFERRKKKSGTSHEDWVREDDRGFFKVTVDCPKAPFSPDLIKSMASQAGIDKKALYDIHRNGKKSAHLKKSVSQPEEDVATEVTHNFFKRVFGQRSVDKVKQTD